MNETANDKAMFKKLRKAIKIFALIIIVMICMPKSIFSRQNIISELQNINEYIKLNDAEKRLLEYKDDVEALKLKLAQLDLINASRKKFKAEPVKLDILASRVANKICIEAAEKDFIGHWNLKGETPYHRWAFAGGYDHVTENAYGEWTTLIYERSPKTIASMMQNGHNAFMKERAPNDGHKQAVINKYHNFVGIGFALTEHRFRYYEEFLDRYLEYKEIPSKVKTGQEFTIKVKPINNEFLHYVAVYRDKPVTPMTPEQIKRRASYPDYGDEQVMRIPAWELSKYRSQDGYAIPFKLPKEGLYYIQIYLDGKEITNPASISTKGKEPASGIVVEVVK